jgi:hypothetical protein
MQKLRKLDRREKQNILEFEINEIMANDAIERNKQLSISGALNFPSSRPSFFTVPVKKEESTDPFLKLLDFSDRNTEIP